MTYKNNFVVCIKINGRIVREFGEEVFIPFGSEYSILLKNLNSKRAVVNIAIDGKDIGNGLVINGNSDLELERFLNNDLNKGYKFKFIEKTQEISDYRGDRADDGIIRVSYRFEKPKETVNINIPIYVKSTPPWPTEPTITWKVDNICDTTVSSCFFSSDNDIKPRSININCLYQEPNFNQLNSKINNEGITVQGNDSNQKFVYVNIGELEDEEHIICLKLKGTTEQKTVIQQPVLVREKITCKTCGKGSNSSNKFCPNCSARLL